MFHFLIMPRLLPSMETNKYRNLRSLLQWDRTKAKETVLKLQEDSKQIVSDVEEEMIRLHGFKWKVQFSIASALSYAATDDILSRYGQGSTLSLVWSELQPRAFGLDSLNRPQPHPPTHNFIGFDITLVEEQEAL
jgi:hypothetical protein